MSAGAQKIPLVQVGGVSLVSAEYANQLIERLNAFSDATVAPIAGVGSFKVADKSVVLDLTALDARLRAVEGTGTGATWNAVYNTGGVLNSNVLVAANTTYANFRQVGSNYYLDFTALHAAFTAVNSRLTNLIASINNADISANCNANSNAITVTLTFPNVPGV